MTFNYFTLLKKSNFNFLATPLSYKDDKDDTYSIEGKKIIPF